ncbi:AMP-binding protein [Prochlorococcus marinus]|uniref:Long-chain fatty acid--CoA ligase n=1 Tax=Prochlorococcus marinus XMU1408 TaxID=2213228 RepID=A0A318R4K9_PROMR|nr:AMP-binding protein [Prochlorococcus marinus]MBW3041419.1 long-chain fatty acid--CoA ligase [Prochlorococcus marinus str. XMU1408]PYE02581.1 long-chain fatty acid--CoA ligase [Prochlorococcus marinus XMU1408]
MVKTNSQKNILASKNALAFWIPNTKEKKAIKRRSHLETINQVDEIWERLKIPLGDVLAVNSPHTFHPESFTYKQLAENISKAAASFSQIGVEPDDVVALFAENSPRWLIADQALMRVGASDSVRGATAPPSELRYILEDSNAVGLIVQNSDVWERLSLDKKQFDSLKFVIQLEGKACEGILEWERFLEIGLNKINLSKKENIIDRKKTRIATILYTSGTTGKPKGVPLTHSNLLHQIRSLSCVANPSPGSPVLSVLPIWHSYERSAEYYFFSCGCTQTYTSIRHLKEDLPRVKPIVMATVPRLWESIKLGFEDAVEKMPKMKKILIAGAISNSKAYKLAQRKLNFLTIESVSTLDKIISFFEILLRYPIHKISSIYLWPKILTKICGGRLRFPISGGGAIAPHVDSFFEALGVELLVGYGLTETSPVLTCRRPWRNIRGGAGQPLPETEIKIVDPETFQTKKLRQKGLVLARGPQIMSGYLGKESESKKVLDANGWFNTGDLGMLLADGSLVLTGRSKDTIVLSSGENIEPGPLEEALIASPLIDQAFLLGQDQKQLAALIVPRIDRLKGLLVEKGLNSQVVLGSCTENSELRQILKLEMNKLLANRLGSRREERVFSIGLVEPFTIENGLLTQTLKQKRDKIIQRDLKLINEIL